MFTHRPILPVQFNCLLFARDTWGASESATARPPDVCRRGITLVTTMILSSGGAQEGAKGRMQLSLKRYSNRHTDVAVTKDDCRRSETMTASTDPSRV